MEENFNEYLEFAKNVAKKAGEIMLHYFNEKANVDSGISYKGDRTIVTLADKEINSFLIKSVKENYPTHSVDGEEEQFGKSDYVWVCDPVDGTAMFARHIPVAVFSLALVIKGVSTVGVVYDPFLNNMYTAIIGKGAYKNENRMYVNNIKLEDVESLGNFDMWPSADYKINEVIKEIGRKSYLVSVGSVIRVAMCVASGEFNFAIFPGTLHKNCDIAAAKVIIEEAGGKVTDFFGNEQRYDENINGAIMTNSIVHDEVISIISKNLTNLKK